MKIVLNKCFGGFGLSDKAVKRFRELEEDNTEERFYEVARENPNLITVVEELETKPALIMLIWLLLKSQMVMSIELMNMTEWKLLIMEDI